jgi:hypothetical protein
MPKLLVFAVCEKVIIDHRQVPSLISIFQRMEILLQDAPLPENALSPTSWNVFCLWQHAPDEIGVEFSQRVEVFVPNGQMFVYSEAKFKVTEERDLQSKNTFQFFGIPINDEGFIRVTSTLNGDPDTLAEYQFFVQHQPKEKNDQATSAIPESVN